MTAHYDISIRGSLVVDGTGADVRQADVAISQGIIQAVRAIDGTATEEIDVTGLLVTPCFIVPATASFRARRWGASRTFPVSS